MKRRKNKYIVILRVSALFLIVSILLSISYVKIRPVIIRYAISKAETIFLNSANEAVLQILGDNEVSYGDIITLSKNNEGYVTSLETNIVKINNLKSQIATKVSALIDSKEFYELTIPLGTFFINTYTTAWGPKITFGMQVTGTATIDFEHKFNSAGINQVLHLVVIRMKVAGSLIMPGVSETISVNTSSIAAQTVIVGKSPEAFTDVIETDTSNTAGLINDYGAVN